MSFGIYLKLSEDHYCLNFSSKRAVATAFIDGSLAVAAVALGILMLIGKFSSGYALPLIPLGVGCALIVEIIICTYIAYKRKNTSSDDSAQPLHPPENFIDAIEQCENAEIHGNIHGVYIFSNELPLSTQEIATLKDYKKESGLSNRCHAGCGAFYNFDIMCMRKSAYGFIFDFNHENKSLIETALSLIEQLNTPQEFVNQLAEVINEDLDHYNHYEGYDDPITRLNAELHRKESWLGSDENYLYIQDLAKKKRIKAITQDIKNVADFQKLVSNLGSLGIAIDSLYLSNIYAYVERKDFYDFLSSLTDSSPIILHCHRELHDLSTPHANRRLKQYIGNKWQKVAGNQMVDLSIEIPQ